MRVQSNSREQRFLEMEPLQCNPLSASPVQQDIIIEGISHDHSSVCYWLTETVYLSIEVVTYFGTGKIELFMLIRWDDATLLKFQNHIATSYHVKYLRELIICCCISSLFTLVYTFECVQTERQKQIIILPVQSCLLPNSKVPFTHCSKRVTNKLGYFWSNCAPLVN